jgi:hypothetical protein
MLTSSSEYLKALREGNYLRFLEWPKFIAEHYKGGAKDNDADDLLNLLVFEWLNNGFSEEDAKKVALLSAVNDLDSGLLKGDLDYAVSAIFGATYHCMIYQNTKLEEKFLTKEKMNNPQINQLIGGVIAGIDKSNFESLLQKQVASFSSWVSNMDKTKLGPVRLQISLIVDLRYLTAEYISSLETSILISDVLKSSRLSVVKRLAQYLTEQTELTAQVKNEIGTYVAKIKELKPAECENEYLSRLSPPPVGENTWTILTGLGLKFFKLLETSEKPVVEKDEAKYSTLS